MFKQDFRFALRTLVKSKGFTAVALLTLAIALGANTAIFSVVNAILLRPLPFASPQRLVDLDARMLPDARTLPFYSYPNYADVRAQAKTLESVAAYFKADVFLMEGEDPELMSGVVVSSNVFSMLGVKPQLGRTFTPTEDRFHGPSVLIISDALWRRRFGGDPNIVGHSVHCGSGGEQCEVIGVMAASFRFPAGEPVRDFYLPLEQSIDKATREDRASNFLQVVGKMREGVSLAQANADLTTVAGRLQHTYKENTGITFRASSMQENVVHGVRPALLMLLGGVVLVLLIGCANVANLLLARATARYKEIAIRAAVGASRMRIVRQLLVESVVLSLAAGAVGLLLATWGMHVLLALAPADIPRLESVALDGPVVAFALTLSLLTGIIFGLAPALSASKPNLTEALKEGSRGSTQGRRGNRIRSSLVVVGIALSLVLLAGAGLLLKSFVHVTAVKPGYDAHDLIAITLSPRSAAYGSDAKALAFFDGLIAAYRTTPGVESVAAVDHMPLTTRETQHSFDVVGRPPLGPGKSIWATVVTITPNFFATLHTPIVKGRDIAPTDTAESPKVIVINETLKRQVFPNEDPIGKRFRVNGANADFEIVGVVRDIRWSDVTKDAPPMYFYAQSQFVHRAMSVIVRAHDAATAEPMLRAVLRQLDPMQPVMSVSTLESMRGTAVSTRRFNLVLLGLLAVIALILSAVGIFSVMSYNVSQRTPEIGIRMAIGAQASDIFRLIVGHSGKLIAVGIVIGVAAALAATRVMETLLFEVKPADPATFAAICAIIAAVALLASYLPARRAASVDPLVAIRHE
jgi:putative ABC transport system permease protein